MSRFGGTFLGAPGRAHLLGGESPLHSRHGQVLAEGNGFSGDRESEGSWKQRTGATNRKRIGVGGPACAPQCQQWPGSVVECRSVPHESGVASQVLHGKELVSLMGTHQRLQSLSRTAGCETARPVVWEATGVSPSPTRLSRFDHLFVRRSAPLN